MSDLFQEKARDWDQLPVPAQISEGVFSALTGALELEPGLRVLDFGAGTGLVCSKLAPHVGKIFAVDTSEAMLSELRRKPELTDKVEVVARDILEEPLGEKVDLIVSAMALHHVKDTERLLRTFWDHLAPGGRVGLADLDSEDGTFHPPDTEGVFHHGFDRDALTDQLTEAGFSKVRFTTACTVGREERAYPVFLVTAERSA